MNRRRTRRRKGSPWRHRAEYLAARAAIAAVERVPLRLAYGLARGLGRAWYRMDARHRAVAFEGLRTAFGEDLPEGELERIARAACEHFVCLGLELVVAPGRIRRETIEDRVHLVDPHGVVDWARRRTGGLVLYTGHIGNWEILGATLGLRGYPISSIARPLDNPLLNEWLVRRREHWGQEILAKRGAAREGTERLRAGRYLGIVGDQNAGRKGVFVPFFGKLASTSPAAATYAVRFGIPVCTGYAYRVADDLRFEVLVDRPIEPRPGARPREEIVRITSEMMRRIESYVRRHPEQYLWVHRRWKTRPEDGAARGSLEGRIA